ncbi:MAG: hypothetical protein LUC43_03575 [Burkholderiales bacterium]|nr:hypothetical protein [Burkholderiales bacterium]
MSAKIQLISLVLPVTCLLAVGTSPVIAQPADEATGASVLGSIELGKTLMSQFEQDMKAKGCTVENKGDYVTLQPGCFQLPGNAEISAGIGMDKDSGKIEAVVIKFDKTQNFSNYDQYFQALIKKYGDPTYVNDNKDEVVSIWHRPFGGAILIMRANNTKGALTFLTEPVFSEILKEKLPDAYSCRDLDIL